MKKSIFIFLFFLCLSFNILIVPSMAESKVLKRGFYTIESLNLSTDNLYNVQNNSINERIYILIFDSNQNILQAIRLWPQSRKYNIVPLQAGYSLIIIGDGEVIIS